MAAVQHRHRSWRNHRCRRGESRAGGEADAGVGAVRRARRRDQPDHSAAAHPDRPMKWRVLAALAAMLFAVVAILRGQRDSPQSAAPLAALGTPQRCAVYNGLPPDGGAHAGMQYIAGGRFELGSLRGYAEERPLVATEVRSAEHTSELQSLMR